MAKDDEKPEKSVAFELGTQTSIDLGEDLLRDSTRSDVRVAKTGFSTLNLDEALGDVDILIGENLHEDAKKILHRMMREHPDSEPIRSRLETIHEKELEQLFKGSPDSMRGKPGEGIPPEEHEKILQGLDADLRLGILDEGLFQSPKLTLSFCKTLTGEGTEPDREDRIDLAIAFMEMGLFEAATQQLKPLSISDPVAQSLFAYALILWGKFFEAQQELTCFLQNADLTQQDRIHFLYLIGRSAEGQGFDGQALDWYLQVEKINPNYRDTVSRLLELRNQLRRKQPCSNTPS